MGAKITLAVCDLKCRKYLPVSLKSVISSCYLVARKETSAKEHEKHRWFRRVLLWN